MHLQDIIIIGGGKSISEGISLGLKEKLHGRCVFAVNYSYKYFPHTLLIFQDKNFYVPNYAKNYIDNNATRHPDIYEELKKEPLIIGINKNGIEEFKLENTILLNKKYYKNLSGILALDLACRLNPTNIWLLGFDWNRRTNLPERDPNYNPYTDEEIHFYDIKHRGSGYLCYDNKTEVFTDKGWKLFKDLDKKDLILTRKPNGDTEWSPILNYFEYDYKGIMKHIKSKGIDLLVTPNHKMVLVPNCKHNCKFCNQKNICKNGYIFEEIQNLNKSRKIPKTFNWKGNDVSTIELPKTKIKPKNYTSIKINTLDWCKFLGLYLSEGYCNRGDQIRIYQNHSKKKDRFIINILKKLPFNYSKYKRGWIIYSKDLYNFLVSLGLNKNKYIPQNIKNLNKKFLKALLNSLIFGDGTIEKNNRKKYYTISKQLADDVQEIAYKCGYYANIIKIKQKPSPLVKTNKPIYHIHINNSIKTGGLDYLNTKSIIKNMKNKKYSGKIYDIVTNNHTLFVRRNNICIWSGNSYYENHNPDKEFKEYLEKNINIYNVSLKSNITIFPKISYPEMFNKLGKYYLRQDELRKEILKVFNQLL